MHLWKRGPLGTIAHLVVSSHWWNSIVVFWLPWAASIESIAPYATVILHMLIVSISPCFCGEDWESGEREVFR